MLGSGLRGVSDAISGAARIDMKDIHGMPTPRVEGHGGALVSGLLDGVAVTCLTGRVHAYEGHSLSDVTFGVRLLGALGCHAVLLTNAAGGIASSLRAGDLMLIEDHLNLTGQNPLVGPNDPRGPRFPDMTEAYDRGLRHSAIHAARGLGVALHRGVYAGVMGPSYETPAEIRMLRTLGADAVGMSTVPEVIALRHLGVRVGAVSCISNMAAGVTGESLSHAEVEATAAGARATLVSLMSAWVRSIAEDTRAS